jgi:hypothetical protein
MNKVIIEAIEGQYLLQFDYEGKQRIVEPHCYGLTSKGNEAIRAYQVDGFSSSGKMGWKLYDLAKATSFIVLEDTFAIRSDYKPGDKGMIEIFCEL